MKKQFLTLFTALSITLASAYTATAQSSVTRNVNGNFQEVGKQESAHDSTTVYTYADKSGKVEPVYKGKSGGYYLVRVSKKSGNFYRKYLKTEEPN